MKKIAQILAYVAGVIRREMLIREEFTIAENKILKSRIQGQIRLSDEEKRTLAKLGKELGRKVLAEVCTIVTPDTIFRWYRELAAKKRKGPGRPPTEAEIEKRILDIARENRSWRYRRIAGAMANLGHKVSHQTVANILERHDLKPAPDRGKGMTWSEFIRSHMKVLAATDFFTVEVLTLQGLVTYYVLFFIHLGTRKIHIAGITDSPHDGWMRQIARNVTMAGDGFLDGFRYLLHDRDTKFSEGFKAILKTADVEPLALPAHSPNLNAYAERFVRNVREECTDKLIFLGEDMLRHALSEYAKHYHAERNHQGLGNRRIQPRGEDRVGEPHGHIRCRERLGGLLQFYYRAA